LVNAAVVDQSEDGDNKLLRNFGNCHKKVHYSPAYRFSPYETSVTRKEWL